MRHPVRKTPVSLVIGRLTIGKIIAAYLATVITGACVIGVALAYLRRPQEPVMDSIAATAAALFGSGSLLDVKGQSPAYYAVAAITTASGVLLPVLLLGAFVYKLFRIDPITFRSTVSIENYNGFTIASVRYYNSTSTPLVGLNAHVIARTRTTTRPVVIQNIRLSVLTSTGMQNASTWPYSSPQVPFTIRAVLSEGEIAEHVSANEEFVLYGTERRVTLDQLQLFVVVSGTFAENGTAFTSIKSYSLKTDGTAILGHFQEIDPDMTKHPTKWDGWDNFEGNQQ